MLGKSGQYYRAGYLCRKADDWPDGEDEQTDEKQDDTPAPVPSSLQQGSLDTSIFQGNEPPSMPQSAGAPSFYQPPAFKMPSIPAFSSWNSPDTESSQISSLSGAPQLQNMCASKLPEGAQVFSAGTEKVSDATSDGSAQASPSPAAPNNLRPITRSDQYTAQQGTQPYSGFGQQASPNLFDMPSPAASLSGGSTGAQTSQDLMLHGAAQSSSGNAQGFPMFLNSSWKNKEGLPAPESSGVAQSFSIPATTRFPLFPGGDRNVPQQVSLSPTSQPVQGLQPNGKQNSTSSTRPNPRGYRAATPTRPHIDQSITVGPHQNEQVDSLHLGITSLAGEFEGSKAYLASTESKMPAGSNKCNEFVGDMIQAGGFPRPQIRYTGWRGSLPITRDPTAKEWATISIPGYSDPLPLSEARPGDIIALGHHDDAEGHVGIYMGNGKVASVNANTVPPGVVTINE